jgi:pimeloyl-ACP methyl ester carboxylesterase
VLAVEHDGNPAAPALLLLHAGVATRRMWDPIVPALTERWFVVRYDLRGYGQSTSEAVEFSNRADAVAVLDAAGVASSVLVGASRGGSIALDTALEHPDRVRGLALIGSGPSGPGEWPLDADEEALLELVEAAEEAEDWERVVELEVDLWSVGPRRSREDIDPAFLDTALRLGRQNLAALSAESQATPVPLDPPAIGRLAEVSVPALALVGEFDLSPARAQQRFLAEHLGNATGAVLPGTAHLPSVERPDAVLGLLLPWLRQHAG